MSRLRATEVIDWQREMRERSGIKDDGPTHYTDGEKPVTNAAQYPAAEKLPQARTRMLARQNETTSAAP